MSPLSRPVGLSNHSRPHTFATEEGEEEFLHQEVTDAEVQAMVESKFHSGDCVDSASKLLEEVEWQLEISQESSRLARLLGRRVFGAPVIDWLISFCYISGPFLAALLGSLRSGVTGGARTRTHTHMGWMQERLA